jgi:hypothetical protein
MPPDGYPFSELRRVLARAGGPTSALTVAQLRAVPATKGDIATGPIARPTRTDVMIPPEASTNVSPMPSIEYG